VSGALRASCSLLQFTDEASVCKFSMDPDRIALGQPNTTHEFFGRIPQASTESATHGAPVCSEREQSLLSVYREKS